MNLPPSQSPIKSHDIVAIVLLALTLLLAASALTIGGLLP